MTLRRVVVESPYAGEVEANVAYARRCVLDSLRRGEAPYASHLFFTQPGILDDFVPEERTLGIEAGLAWGAAAELVAIYIDRGVSRGMIQGVVAHRRAGRPIACRSLKFQREIPTEEFLCFCKSDPENLCPLHFDEPWAVAITADPERVGPRRPQRQFQIRVNHSICVPEVCVIGPNGEMLGVLATHEAIRRAQEEGLDLVEVNPHADPPVCKILDLGKYTLKSGGRDDG